MYNSGFSFHSKDNIFVTPKNQFFINISDAICSLSDVTYMGTELFYSLLLWKQSQFGSLSISINKKTVD